MGQSFDGSFTAAVQHGAKQITLPLQADGNYYATSVKRNYIAAPASGYEPIIGQRTAYTALLKYSDDLSQSAWTKAASTGTASAGTDPEGGATATKLAEDNTNAAHNASQALTVAAGALSFGVLAKAAERTQFRLRIYNATDGSLGSTVFNLSTGAITSGTGAIKKLLNGWYWCSVQTTPTVTNSTAFIDLTNDGSTFSYTGTTGSGVLLWRATAYLAAAIGPAVATTSVTRAVTSPAVDPDDPLAFLVSEMEPDVSTLEMGVARWGREYADVPAPTVLYSSQAITKPNPSTLGTSRGTLTDYTVLFSGSSLGTAYAYGGSLFANNLVFSRIVVSGTRTAATGGTFTLTYKANTTAALAYNASFATIDAAINGLASVASDGLTASTSNGGFSVTGQFQINWTVGSTTTAVTCAAASLTPAACTVAFGSVQSSILQLLGIATRAIATAHGLTASGNLVCSTSSSDLSQALLPYGTQWSVVDANTLAIASSYVQTNPAYVGQQARAYTSGTDRVGIKKTKTFYLPGITLGITTPTDIPIPSPLLNDAEFLSAVIATTSGYLTYDSAALEIWRGPIYAQENIAINMADV